ncbi:MAG: hypothetical protein ACRDPW_04385 [Mycobacteriales bacterium]
MPYYAQCLILGVTTSWENMMKRTAMSIETSTVTASSVVTKIVGLRQRLSTLAARFMAGDLQRGDVPGWVLVTVMSAGLVVAIFAAFRDTIVSAVTDAIDQVVSGTDG